MVVITGYKTFLTQRAAYIQMKTSYGEAPTHRPHVVVQLFAGDAWGWGEASPLPHFTGETVETARHVLEERLLPALIGLDPSALAQAHTIMEKALPGNPTAKSAADGALIDLAAKLAGVPASHLLGGAVRDRVPFAGPLGVSDIESAALRRETGVPIATDEGVKTMQDAVAQIQKGAADVFILKLVKMGGMWRARQIAALAEAYRIGCVVVSTYDTQLGGAAGLHLARSLPNAPFAHELTVFSTQPDLARTAHKVEGGAIIPGDAPGLGVFQVAELPDLIAEGGGTR